MVDHILKHHRSLDEAPHYCRLCMFRCVTKEQLQKHLTGYKRHVAMARELPDQAYVDRCCVSNPTARPVAEGIDYRPLSALEQAASASGVTPSEDTLDDNSTAELLAEPEGPKQDLVTVAMTPELLQSFLSSQQSTNLKQPTLQPLQQQLISHQQVLEQQQKQLALHNLVNMQQPTFSHTASQQATSQAHLSIQKSPQIQQSDQSPFLQPILKDRLSTSLQTPTPEPTLMQPVPRKPMTTSFRPVASSNSQRPTSSASVSENILVDLLGETGPISPVTVGIKRKDQGTQTILPEQPSKRTKEEEKHQDAILLVLNNLTRAITDGFGKVSGAMDWNTRALKMVDKSIRDQVDQLRRMQRVLERTDKENTVPTLKSVVMKK